jgi:copper chaperone CopZ
MRIPSIAFVGLAGAVLAVVALRAPSRDYVPPTEADLEAHRPAPQALQGDVPADCVVRRIEVKGMCCLGCTGRIYDRVKHAPGLVDAAVSYERGAAEIVLRKDADPAPIVEAFRFDKFEPSLEPIPAGR